MPSIATKNLYKSLVSRLAHALCCLSRCNDDSGSAVASGSGIPPDVVHIVNTNKLKAFLGVGGLAVDLLSEVGTVCGIPCRKTGEGSRGRETAEVVVAAVAGTPARSRSGSDSAGGEDVQLAGAAGRGSGVEVERELALLAPSSLGISECDERGGVGAAVTGRFLNHTSSGTGNGAVLHVIPPRV